MIIQTATHQDEESKFYAVKVDGEIVAEFNHHVFAPEDANMERGFSDVFNIPGIIKKAFEAGVASGDGTVEIESVEFDDYDQFLQWIWAEK